MISALYRAFLGREPEPEAIAFYAGRLREGLLDPRELIAEFENSEEYQQQRVFNHRLWVPPGHFYSPIVNLAELRSAAARVFDRSRRPADIDLNDEGQLALARVIGSFAADLPFTPTKQDGFIYYYENDFYSYGDAIVLASLMRHLKPKRIVEFGSGFSSCLMIDINQHYFDGKIECTFVDPYAENVRKLLGEGGRTAHIIQSRAQDIDLDLVRALEQDDILFIDSTHVAKAGSDVNFHLFETLPALRAGVYIHFHDIWYPFEYPEEWFFLENRSWNEAYALRAFLMHNLNYSIEFFSHFVAEVHPEVTATIRDFDRNCGGAIWLRKCG
jgi:predicted O-methyltransferase YrrM